MTCKGGSEVCTQRMTTSSPEVGSPGFTDAIDARLQKIVHLLLLQQTKARSKRMLVSLFQNFARVQRERETYAVQVPSATRTSTMSWAAGYLQASHDAINLYLQKRFAANTLTMEECELVVSEPELKALFDHAPGTPNP